MIISLKVSNFYSIKGEQTLDLSVGKQAPDNYGYSPAVIDRVSKLGMIVGANASGKTNILKAIALLKWLALRQERQENLTLQNLYKGFFGNEKPTKFEIVFETNSIRYEYTISLLKDKIQKEVLKQTKDISVKTGTATLFSRTFNEKSSSYAIKSNIKGLPTELDLIQRDDISIFAIGAILNVPLLVELTNYWKAISDNVTLSGWDFMDALPFLDLIELDKDPAIKSKVEKLLRKYDLGLEEVFIEKTEVAPNQFSLTGSKERHNFKGKMYESEMSDASRGTKRLIPLLRRIIPALQTGAPVILDELDAFLHPKIVTELVGIFLDEEKNEKGAQLIFSSHSHSVMNMLDKYQIFITEKNEEGVTEVSRLDSFGAEVRNDENFYSKYISGYYGGTPKL